LGHALQKGALLERKPLRPLGEQKRHVLITPEIDALLDGRAQFGKFPTVECERLIAKFSAGWLVTVSRRINRERPDIERIEGCEEVWALCPRKPRPGWRILGRFYEKDVFIGLRAWDKHDLHGSYPRAAAEVIEGWNSLFGTQPPHSGVEIGDYLSQVFKDVDDNT
jgi:hypothetical protein